MRALSHAVDGNTVRFQVDAGVATVPVSVSLYDGGLVRYRLLPASRCTICWRPRADCCVAGAGEPSSGPRVITGDGARVEVSLDLARRVFAPGESRARVASCRSTSTPTTTPSASRRASACAAAAPTRRG